MTFLGIDIGTSGVKAILIDRAGKALGEATAPNRLSRCGRIPAGPSRIRPTGGAPARTPSTRSANPTRPKWPAVRGIGLSGHMHGATLLGKNDEVLRPCILWNDGRSAAECVEMEKALPELRQIAGNIAMPGFTAPKIAWVRKHEPEIYAKIAKVLLPKAYVRLLMTGDYVEEMSDASGTLWLDVGKRDWSDELLAVTGLNRCAHAAPGRRLRAFGRAEARAGQTLGHERQGRGRRRRLATTPPPPAASAPSGRAKASCRSAPRACCSSATTASGPTRPAPCTPSATPSPTPGTRWA